MSLKDKEMTQLGTAISGTLGEVLQNTDVTHGFALFVFTRKNGEDQPTDMNFVGSMEEGDLKEFLRQWCDDDK